MYQHVVSKSCHSTSVTLQLSRWDYVCLVILPPNDTKDAEKKTVIP